LSKQATRVVLAAGRYTESVVIDRDLELIGNSEAPSVIDGVVAVTRARGAIAEVDITKGVTVTDSDVSISDAAIQAGESPHSVHYERSTGTVAEVELTCGEETCIRTDTSTVRISGAMLGGGPTNKRGLRVESSSVTARRVEGVGSSIMQVQVGRQAYLHIIDSNLTDAGGSALGAVGGATLHVDRVRTRSASNIGVVLSRSDAILRDVDLGATQDLTLGIQGGDVQIIRATIARSARGVISVSNHTRRPARVRFEDGVVNHGSVVGLSVGQGQVTVRGTRFVGGPGTGADGGDAIVASGLTAELDAAGVVSLNSAGYGVGFYNDAVGTVSATITGAKLGGIIADTTAGATVTIRNTVIERCQSGSGIAALDALDMNIDSVRVTSCPEGGILAGQGSRVTVHAARLSGNTQYGLAAFGASRLEVRNSTVKGSAWATFATCSDGARIVDLGSNDFAGPVTNCP